MSIPLGIRKTPLDYSKWDERCLQRLGRKVPFGTKLSSSDLRKLGFTAAADELKKGEL